MCDSQYKAQRLVQNEIYVCVSFLISRLLPLDESLQDELYSQDFREMAECYECGGDDRDCWECDSGEVEELREPLEFWAVSNYLADKLRDHGEAVMDYCDLNIWCRTVSGQAIYIDYVINQIANN